MSPKNLGVSQRGFPLSLALVVVLAGCQPNDGAGDIGHSRHAVVIPNGIAANGLGTNGIALNGIALNGIALNGIALNGIALNGIALNGIALNGIMLNGIMLNGIMLNGVSLDADSTLHGDFKTLLGYLASCALPAGTCIQAKDLGRLRAVVRAR